MESHCIFIIGIIMCFTSVSSETSPWTWDVQNFFEDNTAKMKAFLDNSKSSFEKAFNDTFTIMKNSVQEQQNKITEDINSYVEEVKISGKKITDSWSYLPIEDTTNRLENPDNILSAPGMISRHGYPCETHTVVSQGYILSIHRIPRSKKGGDVSSKTVLLQHGLFATSADWIINGPEKSLAFVLADAGYDVWMTNIRGNKYSREHAWLKTDSKPYWNFSWHDVALHDVPNVIDYIIKTKGLSSNAKISYIGHSMGTTILFAMLTLRPEYNNILSVGIALAPEVYFTDMKSPLKSLSSVASNMAYMEMLYGSHEFIPKDSALGQMSASCVGDNLDSIVCKHFLFYICGADEEQFNIDTLTKFLNHFGTGTSWKTMVHFAQLIVTGSRFQHFDYGNNHNYVVYGTETPPEYNLDRVSLPITLFWAQNDLLSSEKDVQMLYDNLSQYTTEMYMVPFDKFNHLDYIWAIDAPRLVNDKILSILENV